ncbi:hypothetical protein AVEN_136735-1 [Araneus ventricosus]|uniref:Ig-like domain-containing protein n=1 Tax=Araneus ventricosus TaxID=182803 RepID=A0A4Y2EV58_ARAVE|nr:hypothetical protein AVEN_136735-1 [Araneus ventricosus]
MIPIYLAALLVCFLSSKALAGAPEIGPFLFPRQLNAGMRASVQCAVTIGDPPFEFTWFKDGQKLVESSGVSTRKIDDFTSNLVISKVEAGSNGNYTCKVSNSAGFDHKSAVLSVKGIRLFVYFFLRHKQ